MMNIYWGIVEDRSTDPTLLMRYKVRVIGIHSPLKGDISTEDLPWAIPIQNNSAAISGIGVSANGYLQGSTVAVIFADEDKQVPMIIGAIAGIPSGSNDNLAAGGSLVEELNKIIPTDKPPEPVIRLASGETVAPSSLKTIPSGASIVEPGYIGTLTKTQVAKLKDVIAFHESNACPVGKGYTCINSIGFIGKYQFGTEALEDCGYVNKGTYKKIKSHAIALNDNLSWSGKNGVKSRADFLNNSAVQEECMDKLLKQNYTILVRTKVITPNTPPENVAGALMSAHLVGPGGTIKFLRGGIDNGDAFGTTASKYFKLGYASVSGKPPEIKPSTDTMEASGADTIGASNLSTVTQDIGFSDPDGKYPLASTIGDPDTPNLASGLKISSTSVAEKEANRATGIPIANSDVTWSQSNPPYNATYPYNHVTETESGHVFEMDDTPAAERINLYHTAGTFIEIDSEGNETVRVRGTRTVVVDDDELVYIQGSGHVAIDGDLSIRVIKSTNIEVLGNANLNVRGNLNQQIGGDWNVKVGGTTRFDIGQSLHTKVGKTFAISTGDELSARVGKDFIMSAGGKNSQSASSADFLVTGNFNVDASKGAGTGIFLNSSKATTASPKSVLTVDALPVFSPTPLVPNPVTKLESEIVGYEGDNATRNKITGGESVQSSETDNTYVAAKPIMVAECVFDTLMPTMSLTHNFRLKDLIDKDARFQYGSKYLSLTDKEIACNLKKLSMYVLEPILAAFPDMYITSGFRSKTSKKGGVSQHQLGQAADLGFRKSRAISDYKLRVAKYREIAVAIKNMGLPIDQLIFEMDPAKGWVWVHVSFNDRAKLPRADGTSIMSYNGKSYVNGIISPKWS